MCVQNLKFVALPVREIIGGIKNVGSPWIRPRSLFSKIFNGLLFGWTLVNVGAKVEVRSFYRSRDNRGVLKNFGQSLDIYTRSLFSKIFNGLLCEWTL